MKLKTSKLHTECPIQIEYADQIDLIKLSANH